MGLRSLVLEERKRRQQKPSMGELGALASALSGMSASAGTFGGVMPKNQSFQTGLNMLAKADQERENEIYKDIELAGLADQEAAQQKRRSTVLDPLSRKLLQERVKQISGGENFIIPDTMTIGEVEDNPVLSEFIKDLRVNKEPDLAITPYQQELLNLRKMEIQAKPKTMQMTPYQEQSLKMKQEQMEKSKATPSATQALASTFAARMEEAESVFEELEKEGFNAADPKNALIGLLPNVALGKVEGGDLIQRQRQAQENFINAKLRRESGAAISQQEFDKEARQLFPQPGDTPEVIAQKKRNRQTVIEGFKRESGPGAYSPSGVKTKAFPRVLRKGDQQATVSNEQELKEAMAEGWK